MTALVDRARAILLTPRTEWAVIAAEPQSVAGLYRGYLVWLAAIPALAGFIGLSLVGFGAFGVSLRVPIMAGLVNALLGFVLTLVGVYLMALIARSLAPRFGGQPDTVAAFKLIGYASTAALVAGIAYVLPALSIIALLGALYSAWLIYVGAPVLMKCPQHRAVGYTAVLLVCGLIAGWVLGAATALVVAPAAQTSAATGSVSLSTSNGTVNVDLNKLEALGRRLEAASQRVEAASQQGDAAGAAQAAAAGMVAALNSGAPAKPMTVQQLQAYLPQTVAGLPRESVETNDAGAMGIVAGASVQAEYRQGDRAVQLTIVDAGGISSVMALATWVSGTHERQDAEGTERVYRQGQRSVREKALADGSSAEYSVLLENGVLIEVEGSQVGLAALKSAVERLDLGKLGAKRTNG